MPSSILLNPTYSNYKYVVAISNSKIMDNINDNRIISMKRPELLLGLK